MSSVLPDLVVEHGRVVVRLLETLQDDGRSTLTGDRAVLAEQVIAGLEALHEAVIEIAECPEATAPPVGPANARSLEYAGLVARIRDRLAIELPVGAVVAVVSRGDESLVDVPSRRGWHYPQNVLGIWAGFHPATGRDAVDHLDELFGKGARFLAIPRPSSWWLDHYSELRDHLHRRARQIVADDDLTLYELLDDPGRTVDVAAGIYRLQIAHFIELVDVLLPEGAVVLVVSRGDDSCVATSRCRARHFPSDSSGVYDGHPRDDGHALAMLEAQIAAGAQYLAIPTPMRWFATVYPVFDERVRCRHRCLADRSEVGVIFDLQTPRLDDP